MRDMARWEAIMMHSPGGTPNAFCEPVSTKSMSQASMRSSSPAAEHTASTMMSVSGETALDISQKCLRSASTAVDVSTPVMEITLYGFPALTASLSFASTSALEGRSPTTAGVTEVRSIPYCSNVCPKRVLKKPELTRRTLSPFFMKLQATTSQPNTPDPEIMNGWPVSVKKVFRVSSMDLPKSSINVVSVCALAPDPAACSTSGENSTGPGMKSFGLTSSLA
mmetsp:Transcript_22615/g.45691  ORF Transcript_22615/g.45691 Transcript_22615/m.45691 type:complete len:223 (-) Transcript_22615:58-726(-)